MKKVTIIMLSIIMISFATVPCHANDSAWEWNFFGVNSRDFEGRKVLPIACGVVMSAVTHEAFHLIVGNWVGMDTSIRSNKDEFYGIEAYAELYNDKSNDQKAAYHAAGFFGQALVGTVLTIIPETRHSDFTVGFTSYSTINNLAYAATGGSSDSSDVKKLDECGYNGTAIAAAAGIYSGILAYISIDKVHDTKDKAEDTYRRAVLQDTANLENIWNNN